MFCFFYFTWFCIILEIVTYLLNQIELLNMVWIQIWSCIVWEYLIYVIIYWSLAKGHVSFWPWFDVHHPSVICCRLSHLNVLLWTHQTKFNQTSLVWSPFNLFTDSPSFHSRWLLLLKIEISLIVYCFFIISQNELKF